jgi:hypothetical protein
MPVKASLAVKVFLLPLDTRWHVFYFEEDADSDSSAEPVEHGGLRGYLERLYHRWRWSFRHPSGRVTKWMRRVWDWLQRRMHPDEPLLASLRSAPTIEVYHGVSLPATEVRALWLAYLRGRMRRHVFWLVFDAAVAPLTILLAPLPGPNLIGYWFAYRAVHQLLMLLGIRRALSGRVETTFHPAAGLDGPGGTGDDQWLARAATQYQLDGVHDFVARISPRPATARTNAATAPDETGAAERPCDS